MFIIARAKEVTLSLLFFFAFFAFSFAQKRTLLLEDKISIRALEVVGNKVYYVGTDSKMGYVNYKNPSDKKEIKLSNTALQFRTLGYQKNHFYAISIESPAEFFKISRKDLKSRRIQIDTLKTAFYDALHFTNKGIGWTFSDPEGSCTKISKYDPEKEKWEMLPCSMLPQMAEGEAAFAASNTNFSSNGEKLWLATGGKKARIFIQEKGIWKVVETPFVQGESSTGMYSIAFHSMLEGIAVGGDYTKQDQNLNNIITTADGGESWQVQASGMNAGYSTFVSYRPNTGGKEILALGDQHVSISKDAGVTWRVFSKEKGFYVGKWINKKKFVAAGKDKIVLFEFD